MWCEGLESFHLPPDTHVGVRSYPIALIADVESIADSEGSDLFYRSYSVFDGLYGAIVVDDLKKLESMLGPMIILLSSTFLKRGARPRRGGDKGRSCNQR